MNNKKNQFKEFIKKSCVCYKFYKIEKDETKSV